MTRPRCAPACAQGWMTLEGDGSVVRGLAGAARDNGHARARRDAAIAAELAARAAIHPEGFAHLSFGAISADALGALIRALSGAPYAPRGTGLARLAADPLPAVLGGIRLLPAGRLGPGLLLVREAAAMAPDMPAREGGLWDRRFLIEGAGCARLCHDRRGGRRCRPPAPPHAFAGRGAAQFALPAHGRGAGRGAAHRIRFAGRLNANGGQLRPGKPRQRRALRRLHRGVPKRKCLPICLSCRRWPVQQHDAPAGWAFGTGWK